MANGGLLTRRHIRAVGLSQDQWLARTDDEWLPARRGRRWRDEPALDAGGHSSLERRFLALVRESGLPRPNCQQVQREGGRTIARVDFQFPGTNVVVEVSGRLGHASDEERAKDAHRRNALQLRGLIVLEFTTGDVLDRPEHLLGDLVRVLRLPAAG